MEKKSSSSLTSKGLEEKNIRRAARVSKEANKKNIFGYQLFFFSKKDKEHQKH